MIGCHGYCSVLVAGDRVNAGAGSSLEIGVGLVWERVEVHPVPEVKGS